VAGASIPAAEPSRAAWSSRAIGAVGVRWPPGARGPARTRAGNDVRSIKRANRPSALNRSAGGQFEGFRARRSRAEPCPPDHPRPIASRRRAVTAEPRSERCAPNQPRPIAPGGTHVGTARRRTAPTEPRSERCAPNQPRPIAPRGPTREPRDRGRSRANRGRSRANRGRSRANRGRSRAEPRAEPRGAAGGTMCAESTAADRVAGTHAEPHGAPRGAASGTMCAEATAIQTRRGCSGRLAQTGGDVGILKKRTSIRRPSRPGRGAGGRIEGRRRRWRGRRSAGSRLFAGGGAGSWRAGNLKKRTSIRRPFRPGRGAGGRIGGQEAGGGATAGAPAAGYRLVAARTPGEPAT
jgi:hypothetical protein